MPGCHRAWVGARHVGPQLPDSGVFKPGELEPLLRALRQAGLAAMASDRLETIALALYLGRPLVLRAFVKAPHPVLRTAHRHGPRRLVTGRGRAAREIVVITSEDLRLLLEALLRAFPPRYATGAELYHLVARDGPPFATTPNPAPDPADKSPSGAARSSPQPDKEDDT